jgi:hypothetical protein
VLASQRPCIKTGIAVLVHATPIELDATPPRTGGRYTIVSHAISNLARATMHHLTSSVVPPAGSATALDGIARK